MGGDPPTKQPNRFNWPNFLHETRSTCSLNDKCPMCKEATGFGRRSLAKSDISHTKPGRPITNSPTKVVKHCSKCLSEMFKYCSPNCVNSSSVSLNSRCEVILILPTVAQHQRQNLKFRCFLHVPNERRKGIKLSSF